MTAFEPVPTVEYDGLYSFTRTSFLRLAITRGLTALREHTWETGVATLDEALCIGEPLCLYETAASRKALLEVRGLLVEIALSPTRGSIEVSVASRVGEREAAAALLARLGEIFCSAAPEEGSVPVVFWNREHGARATRRALACPRWDEVRENYPSGTAEPLDRLLRDPRPGRGGRLLLWHGAPGTGKTSAVRALAAEWTEWCGVEYVVDPEVFFASPAYMMDVLLDRDDEVLPGIVAEPEESDPDRRWRLLVLEDCDELLAVDAKEREGQRLGRLLNVVDGLVGQGLRVLVLVTANEPLARLHGAVSRPGRCAAIVEFGAFSREEAAAWLAARGHAGPPLPGAATLAELYGVLEGRASAPEPRRTVGFAAGRLGPAPH